MTTFTMRHNAKRAAERMIGNGNAPSIDYWIREDGDGRFEIVWKRSTEAMLEAAPVQEKKKRRRPPIGSRPSKLADLDAASFGAIPEKPIITSKANPGYQKRFDYLAGRAAEGDWAAVHNYEVKGVNSYAKMVKRYRDRLLAAYAASASRAA